MPTWACRGCGRRTANRSRRCNRCELPTRPSGNAFRPTRLAVAQRDGWICQLCREPITSARDLAIDHKVPRVRGGSDRPENLQATHRGCNARKGST